MLAPDLYGAEKSPDWPSDCEITLGDEVSFIEPVLTLAGVPFTIVGHSYGAAVALIAAILNPGRIRALVLYEPTLFALVDAQQPPPTARTASGTLWPLRALPWTLETGIEQLSTSSTSGWAVEVGRQRHSSEDQPSLNRLSTSGGWAHALLHEPTLVQAFASLDIPILYMLGEKSPSRHAPWRES